MCKCLRSILLLLFLTTLTAAQSDQQFLIAEEDLASPLTFKILNRGGNHTARMVRTFADEKEHKLLQIAEATYPTAIRVKEASGSKAEAPQGNERLWWCSSFDGVRIPYAITKSAVAYYLDVSTEFAKTKPRHAFWTNMKSSELKYSAIVSRKETYRVGKSDFTNVYVVSMKLDWLQYCGNLCAMKFNATRNVILNEDGKVLAVENDTCAPGVVS